MLFFILRGPNSSENLSNMSCVPFGLQVQIYAIILKYNAENGKIAEKVAIGREKTRQECFSILSEYCKILQPYRSKNFCKKVRQKFVDRNGNVVPLQCHSKTVTSAAARRGCSGMLPNARREWPGTGQPEAHPKPVADGVIKPSEAKAKPSKAKKWKSMCNWKVHTKNEPDV